MNETPLSMNQTNSMIINAIIDVPFAEEMKSERKEDRNYSNLGQDSLDNSELKKRPLPIKEEEGIPRTPQIGSFESDMFKKAIIGDPSKYQIDSDQPIQETLPEDPSKKLVSIDNSSLDYKKEYHIIYIANMTILSKINDLKESIASIKAKIDHTKRTTSSTARKMSDYSSSSNLSSHKKKRKRLKKAEVDRKFRCVIGDCQKAYGSENSLNQHIKNKHTLEWEELKSVQQLDVSK